MSTLVILKPAWATVSLTTGMIWEGNCHSSSLDVYTHLDYVLHRPADCYIFQLMTYD